MKSHPPTRVAADVSRLTLFREEIRASSRRLLRGLWASCWRNHRADHPILAGAFLLLLACTACQKAIPEGALVLTQTPPASPNPATDILDTRYPPGSRVVLACPPFNPKNVRVLSEGLAAAGSPVVSYDGGCVFFVGRKAASDPWQIFEARPNGGRPRMLTRVEGGAMDPALLPTGDLVFVSPVPKLNESKAAAPPALYAQPLKGGSPRRLTCNAFGISDPTVLADGRILFVAAQPATSASPRQALFTINNDGTEITAFACQHDAASSIRRPRELPEGRLAFLAAEPGAARESGVPEQVRCAKPQASRARLLPSVVARCRSVERDGDGNLLAAFESRGMAGRSMRGSYAIFRLNPAATSLGEPLFDDLEFDDIEAVPVAARPRPMGHISTMAPQDKTGLILCIDANRSTYVPADAGAVPAATRIRIVGGAGAGQSRVLGEVPLQADGSFMAEVPADTPLGFEALDSAGNVLRKEPPMIWVRPGENRTCLGCHEPHNHSPRNYRPLAVKAPPVKVGESKTTLAQKSP